MTSLSIIAALADNRVIGCNNRLPWHLPADLQHFKRLTMGKPMIMGRKTWESLPGILPGREHVVITRNQRYQAAGATLLQSLEAAIEYCADVDETMLVGGASLYAQAIPLAQKMYLTEVHIEAEGDAFFPEFSRDEWQEIVRKPDECDGRNPLPHTFVTLQRRLLC